MAAPNMFGAPGGAPVTLTLEQAKDAVAKMSALLESPENVALLDQAKATAGDDVMQFMMVVLPCACGILSQVLAEFGFSADPAGAMMLVQALEAHKGDPEISDKAKAMKAKFIPEQMQQMLAMTMGLGPK